MAQTKSGNSQQSASQVAQQNHAMRSALIATGVKARKKIATVTGASGSVLRQKLFNVGILTNILLDLSYSVTIGTANAVQSLKGPYNFFNQVKVTDYDGTDRVNLSGFQLYVLNCVRKRTLYGQNNDGNTPTLTNPNYPITTGNRTVQFLMDIPIAFNPDDPIIELIDLRGAIMSQTAVGDMYLTIALNPSLVSNTGDIDSLYSGAATTTVVDNGANAVSVVVYQDYILPQTPPGASQPPLPILDLTTVYELAGNIKSTDNIAVNNFKQMNYPNARSVVGSYWNYVTGGSQALGNVSELQLVANGNNVLIDQSERAQHFMQRKMLDSDLGPGVYFMSHREHPIETSLFGNIQFYLQVGVASGGNQYVEQAFESFYMKGAALPGFSQAG